MLYRSIPPLHIPPCQCFEGDSDVEEAKLKYAFDSNLSPFHTPTQPFAE